MLITVFVLQLPTVDLKDEADVLHYIFMLVPTYTYVFLCALLSSHFTLFEEYNFLILYALRVISIKFNFS